MQGNIVNLQRNVKKKRACSARELLRCKSAEEQMGLPYLIQLFACGVIYFYYGYRLNAVLAAIYVSFRYINSFWYVHH